MFRGPANIDKLLDKVTSHKSLEQDLDMATVIQISDLIRQQDCQPKYALAAIKKKMLNQNAHTAKYALIVLESVVKNCGSPVHDEVATKQFMENLRDLIKTTSSDEVKQKTLEIIQAWAHAFRSTPKYRPVLDMMSQLKAEGYQFPALKESDAMFSAESAPQWVDAAKCHRCRAAFGAITRKHHCRNCGNVFCGDCSGKTSTLPHFGIEKEVRVCDTCFDQIKAREVSPPTKEETLPAEYVNSSLAQQKQGPKQKTAEELKEEEELELAFALSLSEAEAKEKEKNKYRPALQEVQNTTNNTLPKNFLKDEEEDDPELARYLNRSYWENMQSPANDCPSPAKFGSSPPSAPETPTHQMENGLSDAHLDEFVSQLRSQVKIFVNRMKSNSSRGRSFSNDSSVQSMFLNITDSHSKLLDCISRQDEQKVYYEGLQDKLAQVKDALEALEALREEHQEKLRREAEEAERMKQIQMMQKLQIMRKKKQEYLQHQRQLAIQRVQEQEREMQMRKEQQKQQYLMGGYGAMGPHPNFPQGGYMPPVYVQMQQGMSPQISSHMMGMGMPPHQPMGMNSLPPGMGPMPPPNQQQQPMSLQHHMSMQQPPSSPARMTGAPHAGPGGQMIPQSMIPPGQMGHFPVGYPGVPQMQPSIGAPGQQQPPGSMLPPGHPGGPPMMAQQNQNQPGMMPQHPQGQPGMIPQQPQGQPGMMPQHHQGQPGLMPQQPQGQPGMMPQHPQGSPRMMSQQHQGQPGMMAPQGQPGMMPQQQQGPPGMIPQQPQGQPGMMPPQQQNMMPPNSHQFQQNSAPQHDQATAELIQFD